MNSPDLYHASMEDLLILARKKYDVTFETINIGKYGLKILQLADMGSHIEDLAEQVRNEEKLELPFWAMIWPSSILLSHFIQRMDPAKGSAMLEIGAGVGICGLFAAKHGFEVTLTDISDDALLFAQINILKNGLQNNARVQKIDFTQSAGPQAYDFIIGSEVTYVEDTYRSLVKFLLNTLKPEPGAEVILSKNYKLKAKKFFSLAEKEFAIKTQTIGYKERTEKEQSAAPEKHLSQIIRMRPKRVCSC
ncbi:MAG: class I SAM-dependent methyltransferase [Desulfovibrionales bacterium]